MPAEGLRRNRAMGAEAMRITVVGAAAIVLAVVAAVLLIRHLNNQNKPNPGPNPGQNAA